MSEQTAQTLMTEIAARKNHDAEHCRRTYIEGIAKMAGGEDLSPSEIDGFSRVIDRVVLDPFTGKQGVSIADIEKHIAAFKRLSAMRRRLAEAQKTVDALPPVADTLRHIEDVDRDLAEKIDRLLDPKRELERQLRERRAADKALDAARTGARSVEMECPPIFSSPQFKDLAAGS